MPPPLLIHSPFLLHFLGRSRAQMTSTLYALGLNTCVETTCRELLSSGICIFCYPFQPDIREPGPERGGIRIRPSPDLRKYRNEEPERGVET